MTCFWDGLRQGLNLHISNDEFIGSLQKKNKKDINILWNNEELRKQQLQENYEHINNFNKNNIYNGYDCSICDPFIILICEIYDVNISHNFNGFIMNYKQYHRHIKQNGR